jgi:glycosyltransferase involved in cell wall biosynthesis
MKVLHVYSGNLYGGIETMLLTMARRRDLCAPLEPRIAHCFDGRLARELAGTGVAVRTLPSPRASRPLSVRRARRALADLLAREPVDVVVCHAAWSQTMFGGIVRQRRVPLVFWAHDAVSGRHWIERLAKRVVPDLAICNSAYTARSVAALYPRAPSVVVAYPVDVDAAPLSCSARRDMRQQLATDESATVIIQTSRLEPWKGHAVLIDALGRLAARPGWTCWITGGAQRPHEAEYLASLRSQAARLGIADRIRWLGERNDVPALLRAADVHCQPNTAPEPFGIAFVEALAAGLPVVSTAIGAAIELIDERCGVLVPPQDPAAVAGALARLIDEPAARRTFAQAAQARARALCDPATQLHRLFDVLGAVVRTAQPWRA